MRREPIFDVVPGLEPPPRPVAPRPRLRQARPAAWAGAAVAALSLALPLVFHRSPDPSSRPADPETTASIGPRGAAERPEGVSGFSVALAEGPDPAALQRRWASLASAADLSGLDPSLVPLPSAEGGGWRLSAGWWRNAARAAERCGELRAAGVTCSVVRRDGAPLAQASPRPAR